MKNIYIISLLTCLLPMATIAQYGGLYVGDGATWHMDANASLYVTGGEMTTETATTTFTAGTEVVIDSHMTNNGILNLQASRFEVGGHWTNAGVSNHATSHVHWTGTIKQMIDHRNYDFFDLTVNKTDTAELVSSFDVLNSMTMTSGMVNTTNDDTVTLQTATYTGEGNGRYVMGFLTEPLTVPGSGSVAFQNGYAINPNGQNLGVLTITRGAGLDQVGLSFGQDPTMTNEGIDAIWDFSAAIAPVSSVDHTLSWFSDLDHGIADFSAATVWNSADGGSTWTLETAPADASTRTASVSSILGNKWTVSTDALPLPAQLNDFTAKRENSIDARLQWTSTGWKSIVVERSFDGIDFEPIELTRSEDNNGEWLDVAIGESHAKVYYRLAMTKGQELEYSPVQTITFDSQFSLAIWPNPATSYLNIDLGGVSDQVSVRVVDVTGRILLNEQKPSGQTYRIEVGEFSAGSYVIEVTTPEMGTISKLWVKN